MPAISPNTVSVWIVFCAARNEMIPLFTICPAPNDCTKPPVPVMLMPPWFVSVVPAAEFRLSDGLAPVSVMLPALTVAPATERVAVLLWPLTVMLSPAWMVTAVRASVGLVDVALSWMARAGASVPVAVTVPALMIAISPKPGVPVGDQSASVLKAALAPFQFLVAISLIPSVPLPPA